MLSYHAIKHLDSALLIYHTVQYARNVFPTNMNYDLQITVTITDNNPYATARLDVDLIITNLEGTNRPPTVGEESDICTICFGNYNYGNNICYFLCRQNFHFLCIDQ
ncbi:hypothetical protein IGI04_012250 [Brassica rapa subsp. trilocularis]|uniref:Uncharacterized protein n=1 Tax=Brassica rapa subsp. trilocularis TaxID=1813537 RepID=A0ABQ7N7I3_BRACM|nr:hypothetical protein IGI04_012250 [Brassica rapa subsp. trilocularis]